MEYHIFTLSITLMIVKALQGAYNIQCSALMHRTHLDKYYFYILCSEILPCRCLFIAVPNNPDSYISILNGTTGSTR